MRHVIKTIFILIVTAATSYCEIYDAKIQLLMTNKSQAAIINNVLTKETSNFATVRDMYIYDVYASSAYIMFDGRAVLKSKRDNWSKFIAVATTTYNSSIANGFIEIHNCVHDSTMTFTPCAVQRLWSK